MYLLDIGSWSFPLSISFSWTHCTSSFSHFSPQLWLIYFRKVNIHPKDQANIYLFWIYSTKWTHNTDGTAGPNIDYAALILKNYTWDPRKSLTFIMSWINYNISVWKKSHFPTGNHAWRNTAIFSIAPTTLAFRDSDWS